MKLAAQLLIVIALLTTSFVLINNIRGQINRFGEIYNSEIKAQKLAEQNKSLKEKLEKQKGNMFLEKQARDKLNYQRKGEVLYVIPDQGKTNERRPSNTKQANWQEWVELMLR